MTKEGKIAELEAENAELMKRLESQESKVLLLLKQLESNRVKKDSHNSHNPPSQDKSTVPKKGFLGKSQVFEYLGMVQ